MSIPNITEIVSWYLYGQKTPPSPADLADDKWIRPEAIKATKTAPAITQGATIWIDSHEYMTTGAGRFATPEKFDLVRKFLNGDGIFSTGTYSPISINNNPNPLLALANPDATVYQYVMGMFDADYADRAYVSGTTSFRITGGDFIVNPDGSREVKNLEIRPLDDNFDYVSDNPIAQVTNWLTKEQIDPSGIGREVTMKFIRTPVPVIASLTGSDIYDLKIRNVDEDALNEAFKIRIRNLSTATPVSSVLLSMFDGVFLSTYLPIRFGLAFNEIKNSHVIDYLDNADHFVFFDGKDVNKPGTLTATELMKNIPSGSLIFPHNGVALIGGGGNDTLTGDSGYDPGNDILLGGAGNDILNGGAGNDTYSFKINDGKDIINDRDGNGKIIISGTTLTGATKTDYKLLPSGQGQWSVNNGAIIYTLDEKQKQLVITGSNLGTGSQITVNNFDVSQSSGYLGIKLERTPKVALVQSGNSSGNVFKVAGFDTSTLAGQSSSIAEGIGKTFTVYLNQAAKAGETITLALTDLANKFKAVLGDSTVDANGAVITLAEGQTQVSFALVQEGEVTADEAGALSVSYQGTDAGTQSATSNSWALTLQDAGEASKTYTGDQRAPLTDHYNWNTTSWATDGTLNGGVAEADFGDVIYGSAGNDKISGLGGNDALDGGAGNDDIDGGTGDDLIGGGSGSDNIKGGDGNDYISSSATLDVSQRYKPGDSWTPPGAQQVVTQGPRWGIYQDTQANGDPVISWSGTNSPMGTDGDVVDAGAGDDWVIASGGDDRVQGGLDDDQIDGLGGNDVLEGNEGEDTIRGDGLTKAGYMTSVAAPLHGADFLDGGAGDDILIGGGGADVIYGGTGNDGMLGDCEGNTSDTDYLDLAYHGNDYMDGEDGDDNMMGGGKDDTLYGGAGNDNMWGDVSADNVATPEANALIWGNDYLDGEEGDDTLTGGGKDDTLYGGIGADKLWGDENNAALAPEYHGEDYLDGGADNDLLVGGGKDDTLYGGAGDDELQGDAGSQYLAGQYHGNDYLDGGDGNDKLFGQGGADTLLGGAGNDVLSGDADVAQLALTYHGDDYVDGGAGDDQLLGGGGNDILLGGEGSDQLWGEEGNDTLDGGADLDYLFGEAGDDTLISADGVDYLDGGDGNDTYVISNASGAADAPDALLSTIVDSGGTNTLVLNGAVTVNAGTFNEDSGKLFFNVGGRKLNIIDGLQGAVQTITVNGQTSSMQRYVAENVNQVVKLSLDFDAQNQSMWGGRRLTALAAHTGTRTQRVNQGARHMKRTTLIGLAGLALSCSTHAASFDCAKAQTQVEKLICADADLSKLDEDLAAAYTAALIAHGKPTAIRQAQKQWLKERNDCTSENCVKTAYATRIASLPKAANVTVVAAAKERRQEGAIKGKFISTYVDSTACQPFTRNLNEFRHLAFNSCNPRLSPKFPEFSRPVWEEVPFDLELAEKVVKGRYEHEEPSAFNTERGIRQWESWRDRTQALRLAGRAHMWRTRIDFDADGKEETMIRMVPGNVVDYRSPDKPVPTDFPSPWNCDYYSGELHMGDDARPEVRSSFNTASYEGNDIIYFSGDKRYYRVQWIPIHSFEPRLEKDVGGTAAVTLSQVSWDGYGVTHAPSCLIHWIPITKHRTAKHSMTK